MTAPLTAEEEAQWRRDTARLTLQHRDRRYIATLAAELVEGLEAMVAMLEDSMAHCDLPSGERFVAGVSDVEIKPDGSMTLNGMRALLSKARAQGIGAPEGEKGE